MKATTTGLRSREYLLEAAHKRLQPLAHKFGINSPQVRHALTTWGDLIDKTAASQEETETK